MGAIADQYELSAEDLNAHAAEEARRRVERYLRAWKLPESFVDETVRMVMGRVEEGQKANDANIELTRAAIENVERCLRFRLNQIAGDTLDSEEIGVSEQERLAMLWAGLPEKWRRGTAESLESAEEYSQSASAARVALRTQRPEVTHPMVMESSLTRLPSFRMVAGWFLLVALIVLAFIFTR